MLIGFVPDNDKFSLPQERKYSLSEGNIKLILLYHGLHSLCLCCMFTKNFIDAINDLSSLMPSHLPWTQPFKENITSAIWLSSSKTFVQILWLKSCMIAIENFHCIWNYNLICDLLHCYFLLYGKWPNFAIVLSDISFVVWIYSFILFI